MDGEKNEYETVSHTGRKNGFGLYIDIINFTHIANFVK